MNKLERFKITNVEYAIGKNSGKPYAKADLEDSNNMVLKATAFDTAIIEALSKNKGQLMELQVEASEKDGRTYHNIRGFAEVEVMGGSKKKEIAEETRNYENTHQSDKTNYQPTSMFVSYAKDIFIALRPESEEDASITMALSIELVKQATKAFS